MRVSAVAVMSVLLAPGCGKKQPSIDEAIAAWQPKVGAKLDAVKEIASRPPSRVPAITPTLTLVETYPDIVGDTVLTYEEDLAALASGHAPPTNSFRHTSSTALVGCWYAMRQRQLGSFRLSDSSYYEFSSPALHDGFQVEPLCQELAQADYLAVVRTGSSTGGGGAAIPDSPDKMAESFERASGGGVIDIYELATGKDLGRRGYSVLGSSEVVYKTDSSGVGSTIAADEAIGRDFQNQTYRAIESALASTGPRELTPEQLAAGSSGDTAGGDAPQGTLPTE